MIVRVLFESLWLLAGVWVTVQFALIAVWSWRRSRRSARWVWIGFAAAPLLFTLSVIVVTPREQIVDLCHELAGYADDGNVPAISRSLAADFVAVELDRDRFVRRLEQTLTRYRIDDPRLRGFHVTFPDRGRAVAEFYASARVRSPELIRQDIRSRWRLNLRQRGDQWRVTRLESLPVPPLNIASLEDWLQ